MTFTGWATVSRGGGPAGPALAAAVLTVVWALAAAPAILLVLGCLAIYYPLCAWRARLAWVRAGAAAGTVVVCCALAWSGALVAGWPLWRASLAALAVVAVAQLAAAWLAGPWRSGSTAVELAGWSAAVPAAAAGITGPGPAVTVLAGSAMLCLGAALRQGRQFLVWPGLALALTAAWVGLAASGVHAPEPYTVPAAAVLLAAGWYRSRRPPPVRSWLSYGPGLVVLLLPTLAVVWQQGSWVRPLVLGAVAATAMVAGARARLAAPLLLGAAVTVLDAAHELAPAVTDLARMVPRWLPIALGGLILLVLGATYEARLRELKRLRAALAGLR
jgi:hypothetical protein